MHLTQDRQALQSITENYIPKALDYLRLKLTFLPCQVLCPTEDSLCAYFDFQGADTVAFSCELDKKGLAHQAMLLSLARQLNGEKPRKNILLIFAPAGSTMGLCLTGLLRQYRVGAMFALQLFPGLTPGGIFTRKGAVFSRACEISLDITGKAAHIAATPPGQDALSAAVSFFKRAEELCRSLPDTGEQLVKFTELNTVSAPNTLAEKACLKGSVRTLQDETYHTLRSGLATAARELEAETGCSMQLRMSDGCPGVFNPEDLFNRVQKAASFRSLSSPSMHTHSFGWYQRYVPGMLFLLGAGNQPGDPDIDRTVLAKGVEFLKALALGYR